MFVEGFFGTLYTITLVVVYSGAIFPAPVDCRLPGVYYSEGVVLLLESRCVYCLAVTTSREVEAGAPPTTPPAYRGSHFTVRLERLRKLLARSVVQHSNSSSPAMLASVAL